MGNDEPNIAWETFDKKQNASGKFLPMKDGETKIIGVVRISQETAMFDRKQKDGSMKQEPVPQIYLHLDYVDGPITEPMVFPTGAKYLISYIKSFHESGLLYNWYLTLTRKGSEMDTRYTLSPIKARPAKAPPTSPIAGAIAPKSTA